MLGWKDLDSIMILYWQFFGNHLITEKIEQDIFARILKIGCYAYDDSGNTYKQLFILKHALRNVFIRNHTKHWLDRMIFFLKVDKQPQQETLDETMITMAMMLTT